MPEESGGDYVIGDVRVLTLPAMAFWYVRGAPAPLPDLDSVLDAVIEQMDAARAVVGLAPAAPVITRYYPESAPGADGESLFTLEIGVAVPEGSAWATDAPPAGVRVETLPPWRCAGLLLWGSLAHIVEAYEALNQGIQASGLAPTGEGREFHYWFEAEDSPRNVIGLHLGVR